MEHQIKYKKRKYLILYKLLYQIKLVLNQKKNVKHKKCQFLIIKKL